MDGPLSLLPRMEVPGRQTEEPRRMCTGALTLQAMVGLEGDSGWCPLSSFRSVLADKEDSGGTTLIPSSQPEGHL